MVVGRAVWVLFCLALEQDAQLAVNQHSLEASFDFGCRTVSHGCSEQRDEAGSSAFILLSFPGTVSPPPALLLLRHL